MTFSETMGKLHALFAVCIEVLDAELFAIENAKHEEVKAAMGAQDEQ